MRYGRLSLTDYRHLRDLVALCADQAGDAAVWWHERQRAATLIHDQPLALYAEHRQLQARSCIEAARAWLTALDTGEFPTETAPPVKIRATDFVWYQEGRAFGASRPAEQAA